MNKIVSILGIHSELIPIHRDKLKGLNADMLLRFSYYTLIFNQQPICVIQAKNKETHTPLHYKRIVEQLEKVVAMPVAILLTSLAYYERERLINHGVYFIISDKYAFLPSLIANVRATGESKKPESLIPAAQYILLYHLLADGKKEFTIKELERIIPYNYLAISRAIINLEACRLCQTRKDDAGMKIIRFAHPKRELWEQSQKYLSSPVKKILYSDSLPGEYFSISGVNALSHYSHLNPERYGSVAIWDKFAQTIHIQHNELEGNYQIEVWRYPTTIPYQSERKLVDKLSLYLSMKNNPDPRIEKELEILIAEMKW
ncbi:MAG: hypothetical protein LBQ78_00740 [Tannerellaceae bacterium]|jgi:hypothetical protein|nr:hypothetical protein [Tannerellaceae bacterium]